MFLQQNFVRSILNRFLLQIIIRIELRVFRHCKNDCSVLHALKEVSKSTKGKMCKQQAVNNNPKKNICTTKYLSVLKSVYEQICS